MIYGEPVASLNPGPFLNSLCEGEEKVSAGSDQSGNRVILMGVPASYFMEDGNKSVALVAAFPVEYISDLLALDESSDMAYSFVIRQDGSFVIRNSDAYRDSYFERVRSLYESIGGKTPEQYIKELQEAMAANEDYCSEFVIQGSRRYLYCSSLPYSEWYLLNFISHDMLDSTVTSFTSQWISLSLGSCLLILAALLLVFVRYFKMMEDQVGELEKARKVAEYASRSKSEFLSNMSHDIRTPMNAIVGMTAIATANIGNTQQVQDCLKKITLSSRHLLGLINDVLDMSKIESGKMTLNKDQVSLREIIDSVVCIVQPQVKAKKQKFDVFIHDISIENVCCDSLRLNQVLLNLLSNAIKFTPEEGSIEMALYEESSPKGEDYIRLRLQVRDTGIGMSAEFKEKVFESFAREDRTRVQRTEGTGLGMVITKYIVDAMGGTIQVESEPGKGTEFSVVLDMEKAEIQEEDIPILLISAYDWSEIEEDARAAGVSGFISKPLFRSTLFYGLKPYVEISDRVPGLEESNIDFAGRRILLAEDNELNWEVAEALLGELGLELDWAENGKICVDKFLQSPVGFYDAIFMDIRMPEMTGYEAADAIRASERADAALPIIAMTADAFSEDIQECLMHGMNAHVAKPIDIKEVSRLLERYFTK